MLFGYLSYPILSAPPLPADMRSRIHLANYFHKLCPRLLRVGLETLLDGTSGAEIGLHSPYLPANIVVDGGFFVKPHLAI